MPDRAAGPRGLIDGSADAGLPYDNRGLQYADGLFETIAVVDGRPCLWARHLARLLEGAERLGLVGPEPSQLANEIRMIVGECRRGVLKIILTRGGGGRGYRPGPPAPAVRILSLSPWHGYPADWAEEGIAVRLCRTPIGRSPALAGLKHLGRLEQVLARSEWADPGIAEGLMCDPEGFVIEGTQSNLFLQRGDTLVTPVLEESGVAGIVRGLILDLAEAHGQPVRQARLRVADLRHADALYLTNSLIGVWRIRQLEGHVLDLQRPAHLVVRQAMEQAYAP